MCSMCLASVSVSVFMCVSESGASCRVTCCSQMHGFHMPLSLALTYTSADTLLPTCPCRSTSSYTRDAVSSWAIASARSRGPSAQPVMHRSPKSLCPGASTTSPCSAATLTPCSGSRFRTSRCDLCIMYMWMHVHVYRERKREDRQRTAMHDLPRGACRCVRGLCTLRSAFFLSGG